MKIKTILIVIFILIGLCTTATSNPISHGTQFSLLTASPGTELYSVFGHSALRVDDPVSGIDEVYNYGTFDFNTPNFYLQFIRGQLLYQLSVTSFSQFLREYESEQRAVYEQVLNLTLDEKQRIYAFLQINRKPENKSYLYDFFYDNCATRIRDLVDDHLSVDWGEDPFPGPARSFRDMLHPYLSNKPWASFGIDLALGLPADRIATPWHYMFLPDEMFVAFAQAHHNDGRPLVGPGSVVLQETLQKSGSSFLTPAATMWGLLLIGLLSLLNIRWSRLFNQVFFVALGVTGLVVVLLWVFSNHESTNQNMNLLWAIPFHLYFIFRLNNQSTGQQVTPLTQKRRPVARYYFLAVSLLSALLILLWPWMPQGFHSAFLPLIVISGIKGYFLAK